MEAVITSLYDNLTRQAACYAELLEVLRSEWEQIRNLSSEGLEATNRLKERLIDEIRSLEAEWSRHLRQWERVSGDSAPATLSELMARLPSHWAEQWSDVRDRLREMVTEVLERNERNRVLMIHSQDLFKDFLKALTSGFTSTYRSRGSVAPRECTPGLLVSRNA